MHSARTVLMATASASCVVVVVTAAPWSGVGTGAEPGRSLLPRCEHGGADDSGVVSQLGWDDRRPQLDQGQELVGDVADAPADDEQLRPQHALNQIEIGLQSPRILLPGHLVALADRLGGPVLGLGSVQRQVAKL